MAALVLHSAPHSAPFEINGAVMYGQLAYYTHAYKGWPDAAGPWGVEVCLGAKCRGLCVLRDDLKLQGQLGRLKSTGLVTMNAWRQRLGWPMCFFPRASASCIISPNIAELNPVSLQRWHYQTPWGGGASVCVCMCVQSCAGWVCVGVHVYVWCVWGGGPPLVCYRYCQPIMIFSVVLIGVWCESGPAHASP